MLPRELLSLHRKGGEVAPRFAQLDAKHLALARAVLATFEEHQGAPRESLDESLENLELELGARYKLARGLAALLLRRASFAVQAALPPAAARRAVFAASAALPAGAATTPSARALVLRQAARSLQATPAQVEEALDADLEEREILVDFDAPSPEDLLRRYNLSLAQTLLFDAVHVTFDVAEGFRELLGLVRLQGLMHTVRRGEDGRHRIEVEGPASLFRDTRFYGSALAKVLPVLTRAGDWRLDAVIHERHAPAPRRFHLRAGDVPWPDGGAVPESFDSEVERRFAQAWRMLDTPWRLVREPAAIDVGQGEIILPDFGFAWRDGTRIEAYLEVVGFWTPEYLARKREKLRRWRPDAPVLLVVDAALNGGAEALHDAPGTVMLFQHEVPLAHVVRWLEDVEARLVGEEVARVLAHGLPAARDVLPMAEAARQLDVSVAALEKALPGLDLRGRVRIGDALVAAGLLRQVASRLAPGMRLEDAERVAQAAGLANMASLLAHLGYRVAWKGLDASAAIIQPASGAAPREP